MSQTLIVNIGRLASLAGPARPRTGAELRDVGVISDAALLIDEGRIVSVGTRAKVESEAKQVKTVIDAGGSLVTPGLIDAHSHPVFAGNRCGEFEMRAQGATYQEIASSGGGIRSTMRATREASYEDLLKASRKHVHWMARCGTTTTECKSGYGLDTETELKMLRVARQLKADGPVDLVPTFLGAHAVPPEFEGRTGDYARYVTDEMLPAVAKEDLAEFADAFCEVGYFDKDLTRQILTACKSHGLKLRLHADQLTCSGAAELAASLGAVTADHLELTGPSGISAMKAAGVQPVLLPGSVYALGHTRYPAAREMIETGLAVVLATDFNPGSSPTPSLTMAMSLACTHMHMTPAEALTACTVNAAYSLGRGHDRGSVEVGKRADIVIWDCEDERELAYWFGIETVGRVLICGCEVKL